MNERTKKTLKTGLRIFEFFLLILLVMTMIELMLMYKEAHDHPEDYVENWPLPRAVAPTNAAPAQPPAMAPGAGPGMAARRNPVPAGRPVGRPRQPVAPPAQPQPAVGGNNSGPSVLSFTRIRNEVSVFFVNHPAEPGESDQMTNEPPAELTETNRLAEAEAAAAAAMAVARRRQEAAPSQFFQPPFRELSDRVEADAGHAFRLAIPEG